MHFFLLKPFHSNDVNTLPFSAVIGKPHNSVKRVREALKVTGSGMDDDDKLTVERDT